MGYYDFRPREKKGYAGWDDKNTDKYCIPDNCKKDEPTIKVLSIDDKQAEKLLSEISELINTIIGKRVSKADKESVKEQEPEKDKEQDKDAGTDSRADERKYKFRYTRSEYFKDGKRVSPKEYFKDRVKELDELADEYKYNEVNHPRHYTSGKVECIDAIESALGIEGAKNFCQGNAIKYLFRMQHKGATTQDCEKAIWYCNKWIELNKKEDE